MSIKYKVIAKVTPGQTAGKGVQYCAAPTETSIIDYDQLAQQISAQSTFSRADMVGALEALTETIIDNLLEGNSVKLGKLGIFSLSISSELKDNADQVNTSTIKEARLNFRTGKYVKERLKTCRFTKAD